MKKKLREREREKKPFSVRKLCIELKKIVKFVVRCWE